MSKQPDKNPIERATISVEEAAKMLGIHRNSAYAAVHTGDIPTVRIGKRILVPRAAIERMLKGETTQIATARTAAVVRG